MKAEGEHLLILASIKSINLSWQKIIRGSCFVQNKNVCRIIVFRIRIKIQAMDFGSIRCFDWTSRKQIRAKFYY